METLQGNSVEKGRPLGNFQYENMLIFLIFGLDLEQQPGWPW